MRRFLFTLLVVAGSLAAAGDGRAADPGAVDVVRHGLADLLQLRAALATASAQERQLRTTPLVERYVDLSAFEGRVLADVDAGLTPAQRKSITDSLGALMAARIAARLGEVPGQLPRVEGARTENGEIHVRLVYEPEASPQADPAEGGPVAVDLLFASSPGQPVRPRIIDATVAGTNISKNLRASVNKVVRRDGADALVARLRQLRESAIAQGATPGGRPKTADLTL